MKDRNNAELLAELTTQNEEKTKRAEELRLANIELAYQNGEKMKRVAELLIANRELAFQNEEKVKRANELLVANQELALRNEDITRQAAELLQAEKQAEETMRELEAFSYSVSHDLKAPVRHVAGFAALLEKKYGDLLPEEGSQYLTNILLAAKNMGELIDGLLQFSRTGRIEMNPRPFDIGGMIDTLIKPIIVQDKDHRIVFHVDAMPMAFGDPEMIRSVFVNLIDNAVKFSKNNAVAHISIGIREGERETTYYVKDDGVGFDMAYVDKLFTVFQRLHSREDYEGTGIGLATVRKIVVKHGGSVRAEGKIGEGATFYFTLPSKNGEVSK